MTIKKIEPIPITDHLYNPSLSRWRDCVRCHKPADKHMNIFSIADKVNELVEEINKLKERK